MYPKLHCIKTVDKILNTTGSQPVIAFANDLEFYACKYDSVTKLINEYLAHAFLKVWGFQVFEAAFVNIKPEQISPEIISNRIQPHDFQKPTFGLKYDEQSLDVNNTLAGLKGDYHELNKYYNRFDLLKIALFDLWLANTDRHQGNYNLMLHSKNQQFIFTPIDHSDIFDGCNLGRYPLAQLTIEDSVLSSDIAKTFLYPKSKIIDEAQELLENFPTFVANCGNLLALIVEDIPELWCDNQQLLTIQIREAVIDNPLWIHETKQNFKELIAFNFH